MNRGRDPLVVPMQPRANPLPLLCLLFVSACGYDNGGLKRVGYEEVTVTEDTIDTDRTISNQGDGVGLFVEYASGGLWRLTFACDTAITDVPCVWTVWAQTVDYSSLRGSEAIEFESSDRLSSSTEGFAEMQSVTELDTDTVELRVNAGVQMEFEVWLDGDNYPERYVYWVADGGLNLGMPSPVFRLVPTQP